MSADNRQKEIDEIVRKLGLKVAEGGACAVAFGAYGMLLAEDVDFSTMTKEARERRVAEVYGVLCIAVGALPIVQGAINSIHPDLAPEQRTAAIVAALGLL